MYVLFTPFALIFTYITTSLFKDRLNTKCFTRIWNMICADIAQSVLTDEGDNCKLSYGLGSHKSVHNNNIISSDLFHMLMQKQSQ